MAHNAIPANHNEIDFGFLRKWPVQFRDYLSPKRCGVREHDALGICHLGWSDIIKTGQIEIARMTNDYDAFAEDV